MRIHNYDKIMLKVRPQIKTCVSSFCLFIVNKIRSIVFFVLTKEDFVLRKRIETIYNT